MLLVAATIVSADNGLMVPGRRVRLLGDKTSFRAAFSRFGPNDEQNGLTLAKLERLGQEAELLHAYSDGTVTARFDDGLEYDMPVEALEATVTTEGYGTDIVASNETAEDNGRQQAHTVSHPSGSNDISIHLEPDDSLTHRVGGSIFVASVVAKSSLGVGASHNRPAGVWVTMFISEEHVTTSKRYDGDLWDKQTAYDMRAVRLSLPHQDGCMAVVNCLVDCNSPCARRSFAVTRSASPIDEERRIELRALCEFPQIIAKLTCGGSVPSNWQYLSTVLHGGEAAMDLSRKRRDGLALVACLEADHGSSPGRNPDGSFMHEDFGRLCRAQWDAWRGSSSASVFPGRPMNGDAYRLALIELALPSAHFFFEAGSYFGDSAIYVATHFPHAQVFTSELSSQLAEFVRKRARFLQMDERVYVFSGSATDLLTLSHFGSISLEKTGVFYLDASVSPSDQEGPVRENLRLILTRFSAGLVLIDDFAHPEHVVEGGSYGVWKDGLNNINYLHSVLGETNSSWCFYGLEESLLEHRCVSTDREATGVDRCKVTTADKTGLTGLGVLTFGEVMGWRTPSFLKAYYGDSPGCMDAHT